MSTPARHRATPSYASVIVGVAPLLALISLAFAAPASAQPSVTLGFEAPGHTDPGNMSVLVTAAPGYSEFVQAVGSAGRREDSVRAGSAI
jgi:hypothetical protein